METVSQQITFAGASGNELAAVLETPATGSPRGYALFAHCFTCTKDIFAARQIAKNLAQAEIGVLRFDFTGLGESEGEFASTNFTSNVADLVAAAAYMEAEQKPVQIMIGHSLGGAATLAAAPKVASAQAVCTIGAPADPAHVEHLFTEYSEQIKTAGKAEVLLAGRPFVIERQFLEDIAEISLERSIGKLGKALLICHAPQDDTVEIDNARRIYAAAAHPKSFLSLDGANHLLTRRADAEYVARMIAAWASKYLAAPAQNAVSPTASATDVVVREAGGSGLAQLITSGGHELVADEPVDLGGGNAGMTPTQLLLSALGSCTAITLRMYARRKEIALDHIQVVLRKSSDTVIERDLTLTGDLDNEIRERLLEIANNCPVKKSLSDSLEVRTKLV